jgi:prepilin-type N-terminal cleavage/methylation domain-containing protein
MMRILHTIQTRSKYILRLGRVRSGFTLLETMVAVTLLSMSIVAPMALTTQSLGSAYYARDQVTAFFLAQEALETVRNVRDNNILYNSQASPGSTVNLLNGIPSTSGAAFRADARDNSMTLCSLDGLSGGACKPLQTDGTLFGYGNGANTATIFTRTITACYVQLDGTCTGVETDEVKITASVSWKTAGLQTRTVTVSENLYRWVEDGSAAQ